MHARVRSRPAVASLTIASFILVGHAFAQVPVVTVNGSTSPLTVPPGQIVSVSVSGGPGNPADWLARFGVDPPSATHSSDWKYLDGTQVIPAGGRAAATIAFTMPVEPGQYEFRLLQNDGPIVLATSPRITVAEKSLPTASGVPVLVDGQPFPLTAAPGAIVTVSVEDGPGRAGDWIGKHESAASNGVHAGDWKYLDGTQTLPASGRPATSTQFTLPSQPGTYNFRLFQNDTYALLGASAPVFVAEARGADDEPELPNAFVIGRRAYREGRYDDAIYFLQAVDGDFRLQARGFWAASLHGLRRYAEALPIAIEVLNDLSYRAPAAPEALNAALFATANALALERRFEDMVSLSTPLIEWAEANDPYAWPYAYFVRGYGRIQLRHMDGSTDWNWFVAQLPWSRDTFAPRQVLMAHGWADRTVSCINERIADAHRGNDNPRPYLCIREDFRGDCADPIFGSKPMVRFQDEPRREGYRCGRYASTDGNRWQRLFELTPAPTLPRGGAGGESGRGGSCGYSDWYAMDAKEACDRDWGVDCVRKMYCGTNPCPRGYCWKPPNGTPGYHGGGPNPGEGSEPDPFGACHPSLRECEAACPGVCERRIHCDMGASGTKCFRSTE